MTYVLSAEDTLANARQAILDELANAKLQARTLEQTDDDMGWMEAQSKYNALVWALDQLR